MIIKKQVPPTLYKNGKMRVIDREINLFIILLSITPMPTNILLHLYQSLFTNAVQVFYFRSYPYRPLLSQK